MNQGKGLGQVILHALAASPSPRRTISLGRMKVIFRLAEGRPSKAASTLSTLSLSIGDTVGFQEHDDEVPRAPSARPGTQRLDYGARARHVRPERMPIRFAAVVISGTVSVKHRGCEGHRRDRPVLSFSLTAAIVRLPERESP